MRGASPGRCRILALALALAVLVGLSPLPLAAASDSPLTARQLAQRVDHYYNRLHSLRAGFTETYQGMGVNREEHGKLLMLKPGKMRWDYAQPPGKVFILDGKYGWFYTPGDSQAQRLAISQMDDMRSPLRFLLGHTQLEKELDGLSLSGDGSGGYRLSGVPKAMRQTISRITLSVTAEGVIRSIEIIGADGARTSFTFTNEEPNAPAPKTAFVFHPPAGVAVINGMPPA